MMIAQQRVNFCTFSQANMNVSYDLWMVHKIILFHPSLWRPTRFTYSLSQHERQQPRFLQTALIYWPWQSFHLSCQVCCRWVSKVAWAFTQG